MTEVIVSSAYGGRDHGISDRVKVDAADGADDGAAGNEVDADRGAAAHAVLTAAAITVLVTALKSTQQMAPTTVQPAMKLMPTAEPQHMQCLRRPRSRCQ